MKKNHPSVTEKFFALLQTSTELFADFINLAILEAKLSAKSLIIICGLLIFLLMIVITTWACFLTAIAFYLISLELKPTWIFVCIGFINLLPMIPIVLMIRYYLQDVGISATLKQLTSKTESSS